MTVTRQNAPRTTASRNAPPTTRALNAQQVTSIAVAFLKALGHKRGIKPKHVFIENQRYIVEVKIQKKQLARVQIDMNTSEIKEYAIEKKAEEEPINLPVEPKAMLIMVGISVAVSLLFAILNVCSMFNGLA